MDGPMTRDEPTGIRVLDGHVSYRDGSEDRILEILRSAVDRSAGSDELAGEITDWPSRYHLSRQRANLLRPLRLGPEHRVLEVGAGTGVLSRFMGETGAEVVALEGHLDRARAAAIRVQDLDNVEVVCGPLESYDDAGGFDLVCVVGVLEYAASKAGLETDHQDFLHRAARFVQPGGALLLAIENQLGLKYLLGYDEDHLGLPWIGVEGYPGGHGVRTFTRSRLRAMLETSGLDQQRWFYPFPDYKLPTAVLADAIYADGRAADLVDQLVRQPATDDGGARALLCDDRRAHRVLVEAGLGREVANSFMVLATRGDGDPSFAPDPSVLGWRLGDDRRLRWQRFLELSRKDGELHIESTVPVGSAGADSEDWLVHDPAKNDRYIVGPTIEEMVLEACESGDSQRIKDVLCSWRWFVEHESDPRTDRAAGHPFLAAEDESILPEDFLDVALSNFVLSGDGIHFIDREWRAVGGVSASLVMVRALWLLAADVIRSGIGHPWADDVTVDDLAVRFGELCGLEVSRDSLTRMRAAEVALQHMVTGRPPAEVETDLGFLADLSRASEEVTVRLPFTRLRERVADLQHRLTELHDSSTRREHELNHLLGESRESAERMRGELEVAREHLAGTQRELDTHKAELESAREELKMWRSWRESFDRKLPVRLYRGALRILGRGD
jgi:SAM-dependent methyltransferase